MTTPVKSNQQHIFIHDSLSEGPIQGLLYGSSSVFLNGNRLAPLSSDSAFDPVNATATVTGTDLEITSSELIPSGMIGTPKNTNYVSLRSAGITKTSTGVILNDDNSFTITVDTANSFDSSWDTSDAPLKVLALYNPLTKSIIALGEGSDRNSNNDQITFTLLDTSSAKNIEILRGRSFEVALIELVPIASIDSATEITLESAPSLGNGTYTIRLTGSETSPNVEDEEAENPTPDFKVQFRNGHGIQSPINELNGVGGGVSWTGNPATDVGGGGPTLRQIDYNNTANLDNSILSLVYNSGTGQGYKTDQYPSGESYAQASNSLPSIINAQAFCGGTASNIPLLDEIRVSISYNSFIAVDTTNGDERENGAVYLFQIRKKTKVGDSFGPWRHAFRSEDIDANGNNIPVGQVPHRGRNKSAVSFEHFIDLDFIKPFVDFQVRITRLTRHKGGAIKPGSSSYAVGGANMGGTENDGDPTFTQGDATSTISNITGINKDRFYYPYTAHAGVFLDSREFNSVPKRSYEVRGLKVKIPTAYTPREYSSATETKGGVDYSTSVYAQFWDGSMTDDEFYTDNPAWIFYDIVTNDRFGAGEWVETSDIDVYSLYRISKYCDELVEDGKGGYEPRFRANIFLAKATDAYKVLKDMATIFTSMVYWMDGKMTTVLDSPSDPVYNFSRANVIDGNFTYETTGNKTRANQVVVSWNNPEIGYELTTLVVEDKESIIQLGRIVKEEAVAFGCTSEGQAKRYAKWKLFTAKNQTEVVSFQAALDGAFIRPGDVINIQDAARYGAKYSGRIATVAQDINNCVLTLDRNLNLENGTYEISVLITEPAAFYIGKEDITIGSTTYSRGDKVLQAYVDTDETANGGTRTLRTIDSEIRASNAWTSATGGELIALTFKEESYVETKSFTITDPGEVTTSTFDTLPKKNTVYVIQETVGNSPSVGSAKPYKVLGVAQDSKNIYTISAVEYYSEKYDIVDDPDSTFDIPETVFPPEGENITDPTSLFVLQNSDATRPDEELRLQWEYPAVDSNGLETGRFLDSFEIYNNIPGQEDRIITGKRARAYTFTNVPNGTYTFRVRSISVSGKQSNWVTARYVVDDPFTDNVNRVKGIQTEGLTTNFPYITNHIGTNRGVYDTSGSVTYNANDIVRDGTNGSFYFLAGSDSNVGHVSVSNDNSNSPGTWRAYEHGVLKFTDESSNAVLAPSRFRSNDTVSLTAGYSLNCSVMATLGSDFPGVPTANPKAAYVVLDHSTQALKLIKATFDDSLNLFYWQDLNQYSPTDANAVWTSLAGSATVAAGSNKVVGTNTTFTSLNNLNKLKFDDGTVVEGARVAYIESDTVLYLNRPLDSDNGFSGTVRVQQYAPDFRKDVILGQVFYNTTTEAYKFVNFLTLDPSLAAGRSVFLDTNTAYVQFDLKATPEPVLLPDELIVDATATGYEQPLFKITYNTADSAFEAEDTGYSAPSGSNPFKYEKTIYIYDEDDLLSYGSGSAYGIQVDVIEGKDPGNSDKYSTDTLEIPKVEDVAAGSGAKIVNLELEDYSIVYDADGENPQFNNSSGNAGDITITATASTGFANPLFRFTIDGTQGNWVSSASNISTETYTVPTNISTWGSGTGGTRVFSVEVAEEPTSWTQGVNDPTEIEASDSASLLAVQIGQGGLAIVLSNPTHSLTADDTGVVSSNTGSGTTIEVFSGGVGLDYVTSSPTLGQWTISSISDTGGADITPGTPTTSGSGPVVANVPDHTFSSVNALDDQESITYAIEVPQGAGKSDLTATAVQTFSLAKAGVNGNPGSSASIVFLYAAAENRPSEPQSSFPDIKVDLATGTIVTDSNITGYYTEGTSGGTNNTDPAADWYTTAAGTSPTSTEKVWAIAATANGSGAYDLIEYNEWSDPPTQFTGIDGYNQATIVLYQLSNDDANAPNDPTESLSYNFANGSLSTESSTPTATVLNGWGESRPAPTLSQKYLWRISAAAISNVETDSINTGDWSTAIIDNAFPSTAKQLSLSTSAQNFVLRKNNTIEPSYIAITANRQNIGTTAASWSSSADLYAAATGGNPINQSTFTGDTVYLRSSSVSSPTTTSVSVSASVSFDGTTYSDSETIEKLIDGGEAITVSLSNDNFTASADNDGSNPVMNGSGTSLSVFEGATYLTYNSTANTNQGLSNGEWRITGGPSSSAGIVPATPSVSNNTTLVYGDAGAGSGNFGGTGNSGTLVWTIAAKTQRGDIVAGISKVQTFSKSKTGAVSTTPGPDGVDGDAGLREVSTLIYHQNGVLPSINGTYTPPSISTTNNNVDTVFDFDSFSFTAGAPPNWSFSAPNFEPLDSNGDFYKYYAATMVAKEGYTTDANGVKTGTGDTSGTGGSISFINVRQTIAFEGLVTFSGRTLKWDSADYEFNYTAIDGAWITTGKVTGPNLGYLNNNAGTTSTDANGVVTTTSGPASLAPSNGQITYTSSGMEIDFINSRILSTNFYVNPSITGGAPLAGFKGNLEVQGSSTVTGTLKVGSGTNTGITLSPAGTNNVDGEIIVGGGSGSVKIEGSGQRIVITDGNSVERVILGKLS